MLVARFDAARCAARLDAGRLVQLLKQES